MLFLPSLSASLPSSNITAGAAFRFMRTFPSWLFIATFCSAILACRFALLYLFTKSRACALTATSQPAKSPLNCAYMQNHKCSASCLDYCSPAGALALCCFSVNSFWLVSSLQKTSSRSCFLSPSSREDWLSGVSAPRLR